MHLILSVVLAFVASTISIPVILGGRGESLLQVTFTDDKVQLIERTLISFVSNLSLTRKVWNFSRYLVVGQQRFDLNITAL